MNNRVAQLMQRYGWMGIARLLLDLLHTRLLYPGARLVRRPAYVRGHSHIRWGRGFTTGVGLRLDAFPTTDQVVLHIGDHVQVNDYVHIAAIAHVHIGDHTLIASKVFIADHHHGEYRLADPASAPGIAPEARPLVTRPVHIGKHVWLGEHVCVMPGVTIGDGAIIGAGSVVTRDVPPACVAVGNPARIVRRYDTTTQAWLPEQPTTPTRPTTHHLRSM
jgi:lipopolysaccharide O-acetyltransferase